MLYHRLPFSQVLFAFERHDKKGHVSIKWCNHILCKFIYAVLENASEDALCVRCNRDGEIDSIMILGYMMYNVQYSTYQKYTNKLYSSVITNVLS
jgi:hypothetical protein